MIDTVNLQDIIPDRKIIKLQNLECLDLTYEHWRVENPVWSDQVQKLLENGFEVSTGYNGEFMVTKMLNPSPEQLKNNNGFWRTLSLVLDSTEKKTIV